MEVGGWVQVLLEIFCVENLPKIPLNQYRYLGVVIIIMAGMAVFNVAGYLIEERRRWPIITASPRGQCSK